MLLIDMYNVPYYSIYILQGHNVSLSNDFLYMYHALVCSLTFPYNVFLNLFAFNLCKPVIVILYITITLVLVFPVCNLWKLCVWLCIELSISWRYKMKSSSQQYANTNSLLKQTFYYISFGIKFWQHTQ